MTELLYVVNEARLTGAPLSALRILQVLRKRGYRTHAVVLDGGPLVPEFERTCHTVTVLDGITSLFRRLRWQGLRVGARFDVHHASAVLKEAAPDAMIADTIVTLPFVLAGSPTVPTALLVRDRPDVVDRFVRAYGAENRLDTVVLAANSRATREVIAKISGVLPEDITLVPPVVDVYDFRNRVVEARALRSGSQPPRVVALGTVSPRKGADVFVDVAQGVNRQRGGVQFVWVGEGRGQGPLKRQIDRRGLADVVEFVGSSARPWEWIAHADVVVIPSREEPLSRVAIEAMAGGVPVVAFEVGGLPEALGTAGSLVPSGDVEAMTHAILQVLALSESQLREHREHAWIQAQTFDVSVLPVHVHTLLRRLEEIKPDGHPQRPPEAPA